MEWTKEEVLAELYNYFNKKYYDEEKSDEEIDSMNQEMCGVLDIGTPFENSGTVTVDGIDYRIIQDENEAERIAIEQIKNDLESNPEMFIQSWLHSFLYITETDKRIMTSDEENFIIEMITEDAENEVFENEEEKEKWIDEQVTEKLKDFKEGLEDPLQYFVDEQGIYSIEDLLKQSWINIDIEEASKDAVKVDGWAHFLSHYDESYEETENGLIIFRDC